MIDGHGDDLHNFEGTIRYNFSSNVYYKGCDAALLEYLKNKVHLIQNYPSPVAGELNVLAAKQFNLNASEFLFGNGATEIFYLIAQCYRDKKALIVAPTFAEYEDACKMHQVAFECITREALFEQDINAALVFICNPNNPDGKVMSVETLEHLFKKYPATFFVIDEAYNEFSNAVGSAMSLVAEYKNVAIVRSLTKTFAIPGLRLGYIVSNTDFIGELLNYKLPWTVNSLAIASGRYIFENYSELSFDVNVLLRETQEFKKQLNSIKGFEVVAGETTYFLLKIAKGTATELKNYLANTHGILVRDATNFTGLKGAHIRVSLQNFEANKALIKALQTWN